MLFIDILYGEWINQIYLSYQTNQWNFLKHWVESKVTFCCNFRLAGNLIKSITKTTLANVTGIHVLNFAQNELEQIETGAFDNLKELRALRLDHNYLADINGLVSGKDMYN